MTACVDYVGSGGNINKLIRLAYKNEKRTQLSVNSLIALYQKMAPMTIEERMAKYDLGESRADVIVSAAQILSWWHAWCVLKKSQCLMWALSTA